MDTLRIKQSRLCINSISVWLFRSASWPQIPEVAFRYKCISDCPSASVLLLTCLSAVHIQQQCESHMCPGEEDDEDDLSFQSSCAYNNHTECVNGSAYGGHFHDCVPCIIIMCHGFLFLIGYYAIFRVFWMMSVDYIY